MRLRRCLLGMLTILVLLSVGAGNALANRLSLQSTRFSAAWTGLTFVAAETSVRCPVHIRGSFHSASFTKTLRLLVGRITEATIEGACTGGSATLLSATLPWHVQYGGFTGTLPRISAITLRLVGMSIQVTPSGLPTCLARTTEAEPGRVTAAIGSGGEVTAITADSTAPIDLTGEFFCDLAGDGRLSGTGTAIAEERVDSRDLNRDGRDDGTRDPDSDAQDEDLRNDRIRVGLI